MPENGQGAPTPVAFDYEDLGPTYHLLRTGGSGAVATAAVILGLMWDWRGGFAVALVGLAVLADSLRRKRRPGSSALVPLVVDVTGVGAGMLLGGLPLPVMGAPFAYLVTAALLLLPEAWALGISLYASAWVVAVLVSAPFVEAPWTRAQTLLLGAIATAIFLSEMAGLIVAASRAFRRRQGLAELVRETEARYKVLFERNPQPMWVYDLETLAFLEVNEAACRHYGYAREEFLEMTIAEIRPPEDLPRLRANLARAHESFEASGPWRHRRKDGSLIDVEISSQAVSFRGGPGRLVLANDVTERLRGEEALRESEERFRRAFDDAAIGMALIDVETGRYVRVNQALCQMLGYSEEEMLAHTWQDVSHPDDVQLTLSYDRRLADRSVTGFRVEKRYFRSDGRLVWADLNVSMLRDREGRPLHYVCQLEDITESKRAVEQLQEVIASKDRFLASVSHELRTPLTAVVGFAGELRQRRDDLSAEEVAELIDLIAEQATEVAAIVDDLLVAARAETGHLAITTEVVDLRTEAEAVMAAWGAPPRARVTIRGAAQARADRARVRQILRNLLSNALRYGGPRIQIVLDFGEGVARVAVRDDGEGIPGEEWERVYEPYYRAHPSPDFSPSSLGLGLYVSRSLAELMGGGLHHERMNGWTSFVLNLPAASGGG